MNNEINLSDIKNPIVSKSTNVKGLDIKAGRLLRLGLPVPKQY